MARTSSTLVFLKFFFAVAAVGASSVTIHVDAQKAVSSEIPRTIFGTFLEPIGNSIYGGLWAEILTNPSFEENLWSAENVERMVKQDPALMRSSHLGLPLPWEPLEPAEGNRYEPRFGDAANSWRSLALFGVPGKPTGIKEKVYLPVRRQLVYTGGIYAKHLSGPSTLLFSLRSHDNIGTILAQARVNAESTDWRRYKFELRLNPGALAALAPADFVIEVEGDERVQIDQASLVPADARDGLDPDEVRMSRELRTPLLRFGGNFTSAYHWRDGVSKDPDKRISMLNISWGMPEYNTFGTDEFLDFCRQIGAQPQIALNLGSGTAEEAADWVKYVNNRWQPNHGLLWELGNELWGNWNLGYPTLDELAARTAEFSKAVRKVDPTARLIATGQDPDHFEQWNAAQLSLPPGTFQFLATHFVVTTDEANTADPTRDGLAGAAFALPVELGRRLEAMQRQIDGQDRKAHIAFTEWLFWCCRTGGLPAPSFTNMGGAIAAGGFMNMLLTHANIVPISDMTGLMEFSGIWKKRGQVYAAPSYYAFQLYSTADIHHVVASDNDAGMYRVREGIHRLPEIDHVPYLDVVAAVNESGNRMTLFCVNRHLSRDFAATVSVANFSTPRTAHAKVLRAKDIYAVNDESQPENVKPTDQDVTIRSGELSFTFPHESVTRIEIQR